MMTIPPSVKYLLIASLLTGLSACDNAGTQRSNAIEQGRQAFKAGDYKAAQTAFEKAIGDDPKDSGGRFAVAEALGQLGDIQGAIGQYQTVVQQDAKHLAARLKLGNIYLLAGNSGLAEKMAKEALAIAPDNTDAMVLMGSVLAAQNNSDAAFVQAQAVLAKKPDDAAATLLLASLHAKTGKPETAQELLQQLISKQPNHIAAHLMLANLYNQLGQLDKAEATLNALIKIEPKQLEHRQRLVAFFLSHKQGDKAEAVLRAAAVDLPDNEAAKLLLVEFLAAHRSPEVAMAELLPMLDSEADNYELRFKLADLQWAQKQPDKAEETLNEIIALDQQGQQATKARNKLGRLYKATQRIDEAKALVKTLLAANAHDLDAQILDSDIALAENRLNDAIAGFRAILVGQPNTIQALKLLSAAHLANGEPLLARENLTKVLALSPDDETARLDFVNLLLQAGEKDQATEQLNALFKRNPNSKNGLEALFRIYMAQKQWNQALQMAKQFEEAYKDEAAGYYMTGLVYQAAGQLDKSVASFAQALSKQPEAVEPLSQLVKTYLTLKQADKAVQKLRDVTVQEPKHFYAYSLLGDVYAATNKPGEAIAAYQKAIAIKPEWPDAYRHLAMLYLSHKQPDKMLDILNEGKRNTHNALDVVTDLATVYHQAGKPQQVIALYDELHQQYPHSLAIRQRLASYISQYATEPTAIAKAAKIAEPLEGSNDPQMLDTAGWLAYQQNDYPKAQRILAKSHQLNANNPIISYHLGMAYFRQGDKPHAKELLTKAIDSKQKFAGLDEAKTVVKGL
ncbi:MAG: tetratricopeptide repeat protein [Methylovulum sp.]|nr:tetratricopeptide repeat protein [Methylovulum sp.]